MNKGKQEYDGALISELGVKRYLKATQDIKTSNINFLIRGAAAQKAWEECSFGCHGPNYRSLKRPSTNAEWLKPLDDFSPLLAGVADGLHHQTLGQVERIAGGVKRTAEVLHAGGAENFQNVGDENLAAYQFAASAFDKLVSFDIGVLDNPIAQIVTAIVTDYTNSLPEWLIEELLKSDALKFSEQVDIAWLLKAASLGAIDTMDKEALIKSAKLLNDPLQKLAGKQIGKNLAVALSYSIAVLITKEILKLDKNIPLLKRRLVVYRKNARKLKGGLGGAMLTLLKAQGILDQAGEASRSLQNSCPRVWQVLRYRLNGANMVYFLVQDMVQEYVDRLALLEQNPKEFARVLEALIRDKKTRSIFFPGA